MSWLWNRKPRPLVGLRLHARRIAEFEERLARVEAIPERTIYMDTHETTPRLPDDWPRTVGTVAKLERQVSGLQAELAELRLIVKGTYARKNR